MPGALEETFPDSAKYVLEAAAYAITDEGMSLVQYDKRRHYVETDFIDIGALRASTDRDAYIGSDRLVKFQFRTVPTFGATRLIGEVIYRPAGGGRAMEQMVPPQHAGREVLLRLYRRVEQRLEAEREKRSRKTARDGP